jgi:hypothetical protein
MAQGESQALRSSAADPRDADPAISMQGANGGTRKGAPTECSGCRLTDSIGWPHHYE